MDRINEEAKHPEAVTVPAVRSVTVDAGGVTYRFYRLPNEERFYPKDALFSPSKEEISACVFPSETADFSLRVWTDFPSLSDVKRAFSAFVFDGLGYPLGDFCVKMGEKVFTVTREALKSDTGQGYYYEKAAKITGYGEAGSLFTEGGSLRYTDYRSTGFYRVIEAEEPGRVDFHTFSGRIFEKRGENGAALPLLGAVVCSTSPDRSGAFPFVFCPRFASPLASLSTDAAAVVFHHLTERGAVSKGGSAALVTGGFICSCRRDCFGQTEVGLVPERVERGISSLSVFFAKPLGNSSPTS